LKVIPDYKKGYWNLCGWKKPADFYIITKEYIRKHGQVPKDLKQQAGRK